MENLGNIGNIDDNEVVGCLSAVAPHPTDARVLYVGAVNGGVWKTEDANAPRPHRRPLTDSQRSLLIGALAFDPTDPSHETLVAGTGIRSSLERGGAQVGVLRTTDGGRTWFNLDGGKVLEGTNIVGVAARGPILVAAANNPTDLARQGLWRSTNTGSTWVRTSGDPNSNLPRGSPSTWQATRATRTGCTRW